MNSLWFRSTGTPCKTLGVYLIEALRRRLNCVICVKHVKCLIEGIDRIAMQIELCRCPSKIIMMLLLLMRMLCTQCLRVCECALRCLK